MKILIMALGSRGDVLPYATLAAALIRAGHTVRMLTFAFFRELVEAAGAELLPVEGDAQGILRQAADGMLEAKAPSLANPLELLRMFRALQRSYGQLTRQLPQILNDPCLLQTDLILNQLPAGLFGEDLAEALAKQTGRSIPWINLSVIPLARTASRPLFGFQTLPGRLPGLFRRGYNRWTYRVGEQVGWQMFRRAVNTWRRSQRLPAQPFWGRYELHAKPPAAGQPDRRPYVICGFSEFAAPRPVDWDDRIKITGWWWPDDLCWYQPAASQAPLSASQVDPGLEAFLRSGPPPVFVGLGSMPVANPEQTAALLVEAAQLAGVRLVLHAGWAGLTVRESQSNQVFPVSYARYDWLFPQMSLVIHHGGSGTTGYALASGVPSLVLPFTFDQFYWGERTAALGVGPHAIPFARVNPGNLAAAMRAARENGAFRLSASALAERLRAERGVQQAVQWIEQIAADAQKL